MDVLMGNGGIDTRTVKEKAEDLLRIKDRDDKERQKKEAIRQMHTCTPFPAPKKEGDRPLAIPDAADYLCGGCGSVVPSGAWFAETIEDDMIIGIRVRIGSDGEVVHECHRDGKTPPAVKKNG